MTVAYAADLDTELQALERAAAAYHAAVLACDRWALDKPAEKVAAIRRIMANENPLTSKPHSASSAEAVAEMDDTYRAFLAGASERTLRRMETETRYLIARYRCEAACRRLGDNVPC
jgi:hypothetical protein